MTTDNMLEKLRATGWDDKVRVIPNRSTLSIEGWDKTGKSHLALTAPEPIFYIDIDDGTTGVIEKFQETKQVFRYMMPRQSRVGKPKELQDRFSKLWEDLKKQINLALEMPSGTLVVDTATELYDICRLGKYGKMSQVPPNMYQVANSEMDEVMRCCNQSNLNVIVLHQLETEFGTSEVRGKGWKNMPFKVQTTIRTGRENGKNGPSFTGEVTCCRFRPDFMGTVFEPPVWDLQMILPLIHGS